MISFPASSYELETSRLESRNFAFPAKLKITRLQTQTFEFRNSKFRLSKLKILRSQTRNNEFLNSNFRVPKGEISSS